MDQSLDRDRLELSGGGASLPADDDERQRGRPFLMVTFTCAGAYQRVYRAADGTHYLARCPKCAKTMRFVVGSGGTGQRAFNVSC